MNSYLKFLFLLLHMVGLGAIHAQDQIPKRPNPPRLVYTFFSEGHQFLSPQEEELLNQKLVAFAKNTSNQICIVAIDELKGAEPAQYATWLIQQWGIGQKDKRNGVVVLVKLPSQNDPKRNLFIATGYGLEGAIPDLLTKKIREQEIIPHFKSGNYYEGLDKGTDALMKAAIGEYNEKVKGKGKPQNSTSGILIFIFVIVIIIVIAKSFFKGGRGGNHGGGYTYYDGGFFPTWGGGGGGGSSSDSGGGWDFGGGDSGGGGSGGDW